jgi:hypothetical protein
MSKVFIYQVLAILLLPSLAVTSLMALIERSLDQIDEIIEQVGLFPNGAFFIKYVIQAALLGGKYACGWN